MLPPVAMPLDAAMPISVVLLAGALPRAPHVSHVDVRDVVRLDVEIVVFVVLLADMLLDALFVHLEGVRGAVPLVTIPPDVVMLVPFAVLASVLIDERGEGRRPRRCPVAPGQGRAATSTGAQHARQVLDERDGTAAGNGGAVASEQGNAAPPDGDHHATSSSTSAERQP